MPGEIVSIGLPSGESVVGTLWSPEAGAAEAGLVVHPATATPARFYRSFAQRFSERGFAVLTYDYRGSGLSGSARQLAHVRMRDWMATEVPSATAWLRSQLGQVPQFAVGHSVGGHALALGYGNRGLTAFATVSSHAGVTARISGRKERLRVGAFFALAPAVSRMLGYAPSRRAGFGEDIPTGVIRDWAPWTRSPGYFFADPTMNAAERAGSVTLPVLAAGAADDTWATPRQIDAITDRLTSAVVERRTYTADELGSARVGHHGLMRRGVGERFWDDLHDWFLAQSPSVP